MKIVVIGGGGGSGQVLLGLNQYDVDLTGIIAVTDTGRSTGKVRTLGNIPAPGDIRNVLGTLSDDQSILAPLVQERLHTPEFEMLDGVAFGNLMLMVLSRMTGDFAQAVELMRNMLHVKVRILPVTTAMTHIAAELEDGSIVVEELNVRGLNKPPIKRLFIQPDAPAYEQSVQALLEADLIVIGPGGLFTTVMACLVFDEITAAIQKSHAKVVYICNTTIQPGQTDGYTLYDHVFQVFNQIRKLDTVILNSEMPPPELVAMYEAEGLLPMPPTEEEIRRIEGLGVKVLLRDIAEITDSKRELYKKQDTIRHSPTAIAKVLMEIAQEK